MRISVEIFAIGAQSGSAQPTTLVFNAPQGYFGYWLSAADAFNKVSFYSGNQLLGSLDTPFVLATLANLPNGSQYFGNPNNGSDSSEPFVYLNFSGTAGTLITSVVFENGGTTATGYEADNWSILASDPRIDPGHVIVGAVSTPEPSSLILGGIACAFGSLAYFGRRKWARS